MKRRDAKRRTTTEVDIAFLSEFEDIIRAQLSRSDFGVAELAARLGMSRRHLARRCRELTGDTPNVVIRTLRLATGHDLLARGAFSTVAEVAYAVGTSPNHFSRIFTAHYEIHPRDVLRGPHPNEAELNRTSHSEHDPFESVNLSDG